MENVKERCLARHGHHGRPLRRTVETPRALDELEHSDAGEAETLLREIANEYAALQKRDYDHTTYK